MLNTEEMRGHWNVIQGKLKEHWGQLTDEDLRIGEGNIDQLIGRIQQRIGAERRVVEDFLEQVSAESPTFNELRATATQKVQDVAESLRRGMDDAKGHLEEGYREVGQRLQDGYEEVSQKVHEGYDTAGEFVRRRPVESVATTFMAGMLTGLFVAMLIRSNDA